MIDPGFTAYRGVHLGKQRGGHLNKGHPALIGSSGIAHHIANHTAAKGNECAAAVKAGFQQRIPNASYLLDGFVLLAIWQHHGTHV